MGQPLAVTIQALRNPTIRYRFAQRSKDFSPEIQSCSTHGDSPIVKTLTAPSWAA
jgi:hypothetical protein